jgi:tRNA-binding EMAP/Myf-like protein
MGTRNHRVEVIRIAELEKHPNADSLSIVRIGGYQVVVKTENYEVGDLAIYIQPDSVVPELRQFAFLWDDNIYPAGEVPERKRRITARRFRKEWSEGLLLPAKDFPKDQFGSWLEGDDVAEALGITHYEPPEETESLHGGQKQSKIFPRSFKGWLYFLARVLSFGYWDLNGQTGGNNVKAPKDFRPIYDVESLKNYDNILQDGEEVVVTEKIHGSNARFTFTDGKMYAGSRKLWKSPKSNCIWRKVLKQHPWIEKWCRAHAGFTLYGEVVPTQKGYDYGCKDGETKFFIFDILKPNCVEGPEIDKWVNFYSDPALLNDGVIQQNKVPLLDFGRWREEYKSFADGKSTVKGASHIREGVVIRPIEERHVRNLGRLQLKIVSNKFLEKELTA